MRAFVILVANLLLFCGSVTAQLTEQQQIQKLNYVYSYIRNNYVEDVSLEPLVEEAIRATLKELDPHSNYLTKEEMKQARNRLRGKQVGIGIKYFVHNDTVVIRSVMDNSPALRADIRPNDRIIAVDNRSIVSLNIDSIATILKGDQNSKVRLQVLRRNSPDIIDIKLRRDDIATSTISSAYRVGDVGYISVSSFSKRVDKDLYAAYEELGDIGSLIIDLRDNGGGALNGAINLTSLFLEKGDIIVSTEGKTNNTTYHKQNEGVTITLPVVVLINENSASASEIFAGAIQDHDRGVVVGHTSFGKGLIQRMIDLKDGSGFTLTIAHYKTPSGRIIQRPYDRGEREAYYTNRDRFMHPDSIAHDGVPTFKTLKYGRTIYGGGGIIPDVYISNDGVRISQIVAKSVTNAAFEHAVIDFWDMVSPEAILKEHPTVDNFSDGYNIDDYLKDIYYRTAGCDKDKLTEIDQEFINTMLLASMAEQLYASSARHYIYGLRFDQTLRRAIEIASDIATYSAILEGGVK